MLNDMSYPLNKITLYISSYLYKLVGLLSIEPVSKAEGIWCSCFVQFTHKLVEADMDVIRGFVVVQSLGNTDGVIIIVHKKTSKKKKKNFAANENPNPSWETFRVR